MRLRPDVYHWRLTDYVCRGILQVFAQSGNPLMEGQKMHTQNYELLTITQIAGEMPVSRQTVWLWVRDGLKVKGERRYLPAHRFGGRYFISRDELNEFLTAVDTRKHVA